jgi:hypothetical protein
MAAWWEECQYWSQKWLCMLLELHLAQIPNGIMTSVM